MYSMLLALFLTLPPFETFTPRVPGGKQVPEIPHGYTGFSQIHELGLRRRFNNHIKGEAHEVSADSIFPYSISLPNDLEFCWGKRNLNYGAIRYGHCPEKRYLNIRPFENPEYGVFYVLWHPHQSDNPSQDTVLVQLIYGGLTISRHLSLEKRGPQEVTVGENQAFRLRGFYYYSGGGERIDAFIGAFTSYLVLSERFDFIIVCFNQIYSYYGFGETLTIYPEEKHDSIIANWEYEKTYPNNIAELERAVEQTFRPK